MCVFQVSWLYMLAKEKKKKGKCGGKKGDLELEYTNCKVQKLP